ncbi:HlyD family type I secretion membrane fusion protein [Roseibium sp. TrichSKD4]|uniref:HlyD family type I secretion periplasmic adaptor subunit n=1 Tax=Roseibium sp. TrichSKD4 TaxID=744980 RepID=UPI0001E5712E|nr:HlyD family type I secretion periplasmic adaptor subunit [Roseibium sp. TrichSKD4]EFO28696.1 HlyD family type I secretion membrane fusion protein [Roseibium sp. TrichSKD4]
MAASQNQSVKTSAKGLVRIGLTLVLTLFFAGGAWASFAKLSGAVIAPGQLVVLGKPKTVQHLDGGIVAEIAIDDGDKVLQDEVLIRLDDTLLKANLKIYENRLREGVAQRSRLVAERDEQGGIVWDDEILALFGVEIMQSVKSGQQKLFEARNTTREGQISQLREKIKQFQNQISGIEALKSSKKTQLGFLDEELTSVRTLNKKGLMPKSQLMALERQREDIIGQVAEQDAELARIQNAISETEIQILQIDREFRQTVLTELRQVEAEVNDMTQQLQATLEQLNRVEIKAPVSGIIHELSVFTIGGVIGPGDPVLQIIPQDGVFEIEADVEPQFVDELYPGQPATLRFSAFNQRTTPELNGFVKTVSPNVVVDEQTGMTFYKVRMAIPDDQLERLKGQKLISGMPVEAFIKTKDRTALNYLTKPLMDQINRAFREE